MKLVDKLVLKDIVPWFFVGVGMFTALYFAVGAFVAASRFLSLGAPPLLIAQWMFYNTVPFLGKTFPMAMLLAVLLGFGRLSGDSEAVALFAGGISFGRIALSAAVMGLVVSVLGWALNDPIASYATGQALRIRTEFLDKPSDTQQSFTFDNRSNNRLESNVRVEKGYDARSQTLRQVTITVFDANGAPKVIIHAARARADKLTGKDWTLEDVVTYYLGPATTYIPARRLSSRELPTAALEKTPSAFTLLQSDPDSFSFVQLRRILASLKAGGLGDNRKVRDAEFSLWAKLAIPLAALVFALIGAPLGLRPQRSAKLTGMILALPIILGYYVLYTVMENLTMGGRCAPLVAAFLPDAVGLALGVWLVWRRAG